MLDDTQGGEGVQDWGVMPIKMIVDLVLRGGLNGRFSPSQHDFPDRAAQIFHQLLSVARCELKSLWYGLETGHSGGEDRAGGVRCGFKYITKQFGLNDDHPRYITSADKLNQRESVIFDERHQKLAQAREQRKLFWQQVKSC